MPASVQLTLVRNLFLWQHNLFSTLKNGDKQSEFLKGQTNVVSNPFWHHLLIKQSTSISALCNCSEVISWQSKTFTNLNVFCFLYVTHKCEKTPYQNTVLHVEVHVGIHTTYAGYFSLLEVSHGLKQSAVTFIPPRHSDGMIPEYHANRQKAPGVVQRAMLVATRTGLHGNSAATTSN